MSRKPRPSLIASGPVINPEAVNEANEPNLLAQIINKDAAKNGRAQPLPPPSADKDTPAEAGTEESDPPAHSASNDESYHAISIANKKDIINASNAPIRTARKLVRKLPGKRIDTLPSPPARLGGDAISLVPSMQGDPAPLINTSMIAIKNASSLDSITASNNESYIASLRDTPLAQSNWRIPTGLKAWLEDFAHANRNGKLPNGQKVTQQSAAAYAVELLVAQAMQQEEGK